MSDPLGPAEMGEDEMLAAEHALGALSGAERRDAERRLRSDPAFARAVEQWNERLSPLLDGVGPVAPSGTVWSAVEASLPRMGTRQAANDPRLGVSPWWRRAAIGTGGLLAASLAAIAVLVSAPSAPTQTLAARVSNADGVALLAAVLDPATGQATLVPLAMHSEPGHVPELWFVPPGGVPISLGVLDGDEPLRIDLVSRRVGSMNAPGGALAVSMEPAGGSPTGAPTGPVIGQGALGAI
ncbi:anti-sigma factor [Aureimonas jatrophae]|uniref:Anti-sigma-K factor RskA n=1 Tax=Aureimonas jatrophae TaxID=1166073 RepID=A0A1H0C9Q7_9HYPH|nr:anti-sigma factor [Aureimonas jatrophae]MBB3949130.1 anti-sigma-K factor RskA [Aureimonas jatrophae]SDN54546.1 Anti-sigma-K factor RskA [Aureimonas jatrophae]